ncbi:hypothetical protein F5884DRAFT_897311 [Xylogone sp. PMI_703]|nr:hypothetical protein F5884DRAFT_897311 [Xylogone sp. PMI_703]
MFSVPALGGHGETFSDLLLDLESLRTKCEIASELEVLIVLKTESIALDQRFAHWQDSRVREFKPISVAHIDNYKQGPSKIPTGFWPGKVDTYFDLYVAGVWNILRSARLLLITLIIKLSTMLGDTDDLRDYINTSNYIAQDIAASILYHLTNDLYAFLNDLSTNEEIAERGKFLGGLLLIHPLYVTSHIPIYRKRYGSICADA